MIIVSGKKAANRLLLPSSSKALLRSAIMSSKHSMVLRIFSRLRIWNRRVDPRSDSGAAWIDGVSKPLNSFPEPLIAGSPSVVRASIRMPSTLTSNSRVEDFWHKSMGRPNRGSEPLYFRFFCAIFSYVKDSLHMGVILGLFGICSSVSWELIHTLDNIL